MRIKLEVVLRESEHRQLGPNLLFHVRNKLADQLKDRLVLDDKLMNVEFTEEREFANPNVELHYKSALYLLNEHQVDSIKQDFEILIRKEPSLKSALDAILYNMIGGVK